MSAKRGQHLAIGIGSIAAHGTQKHRHPKSRGRFILENHHHLFHRKNSVLWVAESEGVVVGCCGLYPDAALPDDTVELVKFYIASSARGKGIGKALMEKCIASAREFSFRKIYIESLPEFHVAVSLYLKYGFQYIDTALGHSTHPGCNVWMVKEI